MVTRCIDENKEELLLFLKKKPAAHCLFLGDLENYSLSGDFIKIWMIKKNGLITSVILRFYSYCTISVSDIDDVEEIVDCLRTEKGIKSISGEASVIDIIKNRIEHSQISKTFYAELKELDDGSCIDEPEIFRADCEDLNELFDFHRSIEEFDVSEDEREDFGRKITNGTGRISYIRREGRISSMAAITAENSVNGMIVDVATARPFRGRGFARILVRQLCRSMVESGKSVVLFYNNPSAGRMYKELGFRDIGVRATILLS